ncbi:hypothetical protein HZC07_01780 [Candidatus Micrarchaeota archaeon]|nr:hypothetical protein [Candidatus Micrarchaeota archaeon]
MKLEGIAPKQTDTKQGYTFADKARAFCRGLRTGSPLLEVAREGIKRNEYTKGHIARMIRHADIEEIYKVFVLDATPENVQRIDLWLLQKRIEKEIRQLRRVNLGGGCLCFSPENANAVFSEKDWRSAWVTTVRYEKREYFTTDEDTVFKFTDIEILLSGMQETFGMQIPKERCWFDKIDIHIARTDYLRAMTFLELVVEV